MVKPVKTSDYPTRARRPAYSVMSGRKLKDAFGIELPNWKEQLYKAVESELISEQ